MEKITVLRESSSMFNLQKLIVSDQLYPSSYNGKFVCITISDDIFCICQIFLSRILHPTFGNIDTSVCGYYESTASNLYPLDKTNTSLSISNIDFLSSLSYMKNVTVSLVFSTTVMCNKYKSDITKLTDSVKHILQLFVLKTGSIVSLDAIKTLFNVKVEYILIENTGNINVGRVVNATKVKINKLISRMTFEQLFTTREDLPVLGGLELPSKTLTEIIKTVGMKGNSNLPLYKQVLILGPSGCGKKSLVYGISRDHGFVLKSIAGPELATPLPGEAEKHLTAIFEECKLLAQECSGCVLLIEHVETVCGRREGSAEGHVVRLADRLCSLLETVNTTPGLMVVGTSSQPQALDPAVRRPGRFDHEIHIGVSSEGERASVLHVVCGQFGLNDALCDLVAKWTPGFVGADLALLASNVARHLNKLGLPRTFDDKERLTSYWRTCVGQLQPSALRGQLGVMQMSVVGDVSLDQLGGVETVKLKLQQAVEWPLTHPEAFKRMGLPHPKGVLLYGPPGCAKTSLVRAIAASTNTTFLTASAAQIYSPYVGEAERIISELFHRARIGAPTILFIDEIDALVGCRGHREKGSQERILTTFLTEMDGVGVRLDTGASQAGVVVIAATNRPDVIDPALTRPGRFDRLIYVGPPNTSQRLEILRTLTRKMPMAADVDLLWLAEHTELYSGADLTRLCKEAGLCALTQDGMSVTEVSHSHWKSALQDMRPSLSKEQVLKYQNMVPFAV